MTIADFRLILVQTVTMDKTQFKSRTQSFAISVATFCKTLPYESIARHYIDQIIRSSASVGADYGALCRAKSKADFINKMRIVEEEADETMYFLELIAEFYSNRRKELRLLYKEGNEILAMTVGSINTALKSVKQSAI